MGRKRIPRSCRRNPLCCNEGLIDALHFFFFFFLIWSTVLVGFFGFFFFFSCLWAPKYSPSPANSFLFRF